jgi:hypothetical protein
MMTLILVLAGCENHALENMDKLDENGNIVSVNYPDDTYQNEPNNETIYLTTSYDEGFGLEDRIFIDQETTFFLPQEIEAQGEGTLKWIVLSFEEESFCYLRSQATKKYKLSHKKRNKSCDSGITELSQTTITVKENTKVTLNPEVDTCDLDDCSYTEVGAELKPFTETIVY